MLYINGPIQELKYTLGVYVENHYNVNREFFIRIRLDHRNLGENDSLTQLLEDPLISETCPLEENASHHEVANKADGETVESNSSGLKCNGI